MTDIKRTLAQIADQCTDAFFKATKGHVSHTDALRAYAEALAAIREKAQNALGEIMEAEKQ